MGPKMDCYTASRRILAPFLQTSFASVAFAAALILLPAGAPPAFAADPAPSAADQNCLGCHGAAGMEKKLADGDTLQLHVPADGYVNSVHGANGCTSCHADVDPAKHPPEKNEIASKRSFSLAMTQVCHTCHADKFEQWQSSIHAALVQSGNPAAPVCTDCHNPHAVIKNAATQIEQVPCKNCHADVFTAYLGSVHAKSRLSSKDSYAPTCSGCHTAHSVKAISAGPFGQGPETACFGCHAGLLESHQKWLPNAALHFDAIACPACHVAGAHRRVDLMLIDGKGDARGTEQIGVPLFEASARSDSKGIDARSLWDLMQSLNRSGIAGKTTLRGHLDVLTGPQAHQIADKSHALSDCHTCHRKGSQAFESVSISLVGPEGRRVRYGANADVLNSPFSVGSVSGFYAIGGTRIWILDILLALAILGGVGIAVGHVFLGWMFKRFGLYQPHNGHGHSPASGDDAPKPAA
jgi:hypothetical protein